MNYQRKKNMFRLKFYALMFAVIIGLLTTFGQMAQGQTIINPSFETDNVPASPGYGAITGWTVTGFEGSSGINNSTGPFANNGAIPDGQKVAFLHEPSVSGYKQGGTIRQTVSGFTVGAQYRLRYFENAFLPDPLFHNTAYLQASVGGAVVVPTHEVLKVGGTNPYVLKVSEPFTATAESLEIAFTTAGRYDYTVLLDNISVLPDSVVGTNLVVTNNLDSGAGSLRQAVIDAPAFSTIRFSDAVRGTILLSGGVGIHKNLTIAGPGADALTITGYGGFGVFEDVTATISGLTIADAGGIGNSGNLTVTDSVVRSNSGNGILSVGNLTVVNSDLSYNAGSGIYTFCPTPELQNTYFVCLVPNRLTITNSNISHNDAGRGGGIFISQSDVVITNSSITSNNASTLPVESGAVAAAGAGIFNEAGRLTITNSTIAGNEDVGVVCNNGTTLCPPQYGGDGITLTKWEPVVGNQADAYGEVNLINATVTDNIYASGPVSARNSIINSVNAVNSQGYNLFVYPPSITGDTTGNILGANPRLAPVGYYGGTTLTRPLLTGSPAINTGNTATSPATDQRGAARVGAADIGAFEVNNSANVVTQLPDAFTEIAYSHLLVSDASGFTYSLTGGALPTGISLTTRFQRVLVSGRTAQTGVFAFSVTVSDGTNSFVADYRLRVLPSGAPPHPGGCVSNPVVANNSDGGEGTLRQAVIDACAGGTITFGAAGRGRISLTTGPIEINKNLAIAGPGADALTIRNGAGKGPQNNVIQVNSGNAAVILSGLTITDGYAYGNGADGYPDGGGGILNSGNLTVRNAVIRNNRTPGPGGGIESEGTLTILNSVVTGNGQSADGQLNGISQGGGIYFTGLSLTITDSEVSGNQADVGGGIWANYYSPVTITNSTIRDNKSVFRAGGLYVGIATLTNCTVSQNLVYNGPGGGIYIQNDDTLTLINTTVAYNTADSGGGISNFLGSGTVNARNSIIAENIVIGSSGGKDFGGTLTSQGYNLIGSNDFGMEIVGDTTGNIVGTPQGPFINPRLGPLDYYGGPTQTYPLLTGSPAINAGNTATSPATDQRGAARVGAADIGAFEVNNSANGGSFVVQLPRGTRNVAYQTQIAANNGGFTYSVTSGALPNGIKLSTNFAPTAVVALSGTPTEGGLFNFAITTTNGTNSNVTNYSLQILIPTAASVSVAGRVTVGTSGVTNAVVTLTDSNGNSRIARTSPFGYYSFDEVEVGQNYIISVSSKRYQFETQVVFVTEDVGDLNFTASP
jgi:hypothetical protein